MGGAKVILGFPHVGDIKPYFFDTVLSLKNSGVRLGAVRVQNKPVDMARNMIVSAFLDDPTATHLFFMDSDQMFHPDSLNRLLERDLDVVGGTYFARTETPIPHFYRYVKDAADEKGQVRRYYRTLGQEFAGWWNSRPDTTEQPHAYVYPKRDGDLVRCDAVATGCLLIKRAVLEAIGEPWFQCWPGSVGGEDFDFCEKARAAGFEVWGDFSVQCGHEQQMAFVGATTFAETYAIGTDHEYDFVEPVLVEGGPNGRRVRLANDPTGAPATLRRPLQNSSEVA